MGNKNVRAAAAPLSLAPPTLLTILWFVALALPNLVYSGVRFADTLHILKWAVAGLPVAIAALVAGGRLLVYGKPRIEFRMDLFGSIWAVLLLYCVAQPVWLGMLGTPISSMTTLVHELVCFAAVWAFYVISVDSFPEWGLRPLLWLANVNAVVNVLFAELQIRNLGNLDFLQGTVWEFLRPMGSLILPTPGNYIGNTAQQNMFGLWMAVCVMSSVYLFLAYAVREDGSKRPLWLTLLNLVLMGINVWGLWNSTSRSGILSLFVGLFVLGLVTAVRYGRAYLHRFGVVLLLFAAVLGGAMLQNRDRASALIEKTGDMLRNPETVGGRIGIWTTSYTMFKEHPMGVGVGQYKWHYLKAQREAFRTKNEPWYAWQYTHWAHNEFLQWFCEAGVIGGTMLLLMFGLWGVAAFRKIFSRGERESPLPLSVIWGCALVALVAFNAIWTRPFHRIENILWLALAFAITNREFLTGRLGWKMDCTKGFTRLIGAVFVCASLAGTVYLGSGIEGNLLLRQALSTRNASLQRSLLERAAVHPIVMEEAMRNLGYHYLQVGEQTQDLGTMERGFNLLWQHFQREPHSEDMTSLMNWAQRFQMEEVLREIASYLKPGTYRLERQMGTDRDGNVVSYLALVPIQSSGGMRVIEQPSPSPDAASDETGPSQGSGASQDSGNER